MTILRTWACVVACVLAIGGCDYVVIPPENGGQAPVSSKGWTAVATSVGPNDAGDLEVTLALRNETGSWSALDAVAGRPASLTGGDGKTSECTAVVVGTGGHRLAPGFQMRGFVKGPKSGPTTEPIRVGCKGAQAAPGSRLAIDVTYVTGEYNYYDPDASRFTSKLEVDLDKIVADLTFPVAETVDGVIVGPDAQIEAINGVTLTLTGVERNDAGLRMSWQTSNPGEYPSFVHIGIPPVIGSDGILYGVYESPDLATVPLTPAKGTADWTTEVAVPADVEGLFVMLSVESKKQRLFVNYAIDLGDV